MLASSLAGKAAALAAALMTSHAESTIAVRPIPHGLGAYVKPESTHASSMSVYLHGVCGRAENGCPYFASGTSRVTWGVCPQAPSVCSGGGTRWNGSPTSTSLRVEQAIREVTTLYPDAVDATTTRVLIGFSQGAFAADQLLRHARAGQYHAVAFVSAFVEPSISALRKAGIQRVLLASARNDASYAHLRVLETRLVEAGCEVTFLDLGRVGHSYVPAAGTPGWTHAMRWLHGME